ncbi:MAG: tripartite tricarboxylate transporter TctB family protein [Colwellia sp.]|uniref:tripartite tricarboxylate transporter TctB family protein n=1 Tax=Colwellia sp. TaxID=56799 RepID=UPI0025BFA0D0|nr:tripartite tricarboxylate transporter TctB family protein [Colwellia sp.]NQZ25121.1 tripartite tricarboxylate transporter TctB family protein [Colwellia sp.]
MKISTNVIGALIFFIFSVCYGYYAYQIPLYPGEEYDVFTSQSMPKLYALLGILVSALAIIMSVLTDSSTSDETEESANGFDKKGWFQVASLIALMVYYGATLEQLGFILSTISFLIFGFLILGERSKKRLFLASVPVVIVFWAIMTQLLGIYLSTGDLWG